MNLDDLFNNSFEKKVADENIVKNKVNECRDLMIQKFGDIKFLEEGHQYFIGDQEYIPVSNIIKRYEPVVDWDQKAADYALKYGKKKEDVQKDWRLNNLKSTISGTRTHEFGESYTNVMCGHPELICEQNKPQYIKEYNTMVATYPKEDAVKKFYDELESNLHPVGAEFKLSTKYMDWAERICGTCDLLFYDSDKDGYVLMDWKTNKSLIKEFSRTNGIMMTGLMSKYVDEPLSHYTLQFNIYQRLLESIGLKIIDRVLIWLKDDGTYEKISIGKIPDEVIEKILKGEE
jgi:hypothetical protein